MWLPKSEREIIDIVNSGTLEETVIFEAKIEISSKNQEIAKDIASMANEGGVIIYGIGEDDNKRLKILSPITLAGQAERIDAIIRTCITEPPKVHITSIPTEKDPSKGYLIILIPPSERAPHMVVVKGENRYYGRSGTINIPLNEGEVARLYTRREKTETDLGALIDEEIKTSPFEINYNLAYLFLISKPVFSKEGFFPNFKNEEEFQEKLQRLIIQACDVNIFRRTFAPDFRPPGIWKQRVDGLMGLMDYGANDLNNSTKFVRRYLSIQSNYNGICRLFCGRAGEKIENNQNISIYPEIIAGLTTRFIFFVSHLYELAEYIGMVDFGIGITGIKDGIVYSNDLMIQYTISPYEYDTYKRTGRFSNLVILDDPKYVAEYLVMPFIKAISQNRINPFKNPSNITS